MSDDSSNDGDNKDFDIDEKIYEMKLKLGQSKKILP